jgi:glutamate-1-semialdehyde aminotransferase
VHDAIRAGNTSGLPSTLEVEVAERLSEVIPCAERVRFLKTGAEATAAAVRLARAATGRNLVLGSGYFGWLDWCSDQPGVPDAVKSDFRSIPFNNVGAMESAVRAVRAELAAVIVEPVVDELADEGWMRRIREACSAAGAALIFDEMKTGFRLRTGGYQQMSEITPDLAVFGKAMANGFPIAAVVGNAAIMEHANSTWISSTLAGETAGLAAAAAVLDWHERAEVCESLWSIGAEMRAAVASAIEASGLQGAEVRGLDPMWYIEFANPAHRDRFVELAFEEGVLFKRGTYNFASLSHEEEALRSIEYAASRACVQIVDEESAQG